MNDLKFLQGKFQNIPDKNIYQHYDPRVENNSAFYDFLPSATLTQRPTHEVGTKNAKSNRKLKFLFYDNHSLTIVPQQKKYFPQTRSAFMQKAFILKTVYSNFQSPEPMATRTVFRNKQVKFTFYKSTALNYR